MTDHTASNSRVTITAFVVAKYKMDHSSSTFTRR